VHRDVGKTCNGIVLYLALGWNTSERPFGGSLLQQYILWAWNYLERQILILRSKSSTLSILGTLLLWSSDTPFPL